MVTGGGRGVGRALVERLLADEAVTGQAADLAEAAAPLAGWVNNAALFRDASLAADPAAVLRAIELNLAPAVVGSATAVRRFLAAGTGGAIVNVSSHQARRCGATIPVDGGRAVLGGDPESAPPASGP